jgi:hypothetical protein
VLQEYENTGDRLEARLKRLQGWESERRRAEVPTPLFLVDVASKGFSSSVSLLFATLAGKTISVASKELKEEEQGSNEVTR